MTMAGERPVLVVGAGPTGLAAALELARLGRPVRIIDRKAAPLAALQGDRGQSAHARVAGGGRRHRAAAGRRPADPQGQPAPRRPPARRDRPVPSRASLQFHAGARPERDRADAGGEPRRARRPGRMAARAQGVRDSATTGSGPRSVRDGDEQEVEADYLIGADGAHSTARHALGLEFRGDHLSVRVAGGRCPRCPGRSPRTRCTCGSATAALAVPDQRRGRHLSPGQRRRGAAAAAARRLRGARDPLALRLPDQLPPGRALSAGARVPGGRRRAHPLAGRRPRHEPRHRGWRRSWPARSRAAGSRATPPSAIRSGRA